jgi:hypothetical protein
MFAETACPVKLIPVDNRTIDYSHGLLSCGQLSGGQALSSSENDMITLSAVTLPIV